jgi:hypothetical protein
MLRARIHQGRVEVQDPIPKDWEGQLVKILPLTPDDPTQDLEYRLAAMEALGPMEFEPRERQLVGQVLGELDRLSRDAMPLGRAIAGRKTRLHGARRHLVALRSASAAAEFAHAAKRNTVHGKLLDSRRVEGK